MRILGLVLAVLLVAIQYPLWFGKGGWLRTWELERQLSAQRATNEQLAARNAAAAAEVASLREGNEAIAEQAGTSHRELAARGNLNVIVNAQRHRDAFTARGDFRSAGNESNFRAGQQYVRTLQKSARIGELHR